MTTDAPIVTIGVSTFVNDQDALFVAEQAGDLFPALPAQEVVDGVTIEGAEAVSAFRYASSDGAGLDSFRLVMAAGGVLTVIDVQQSAGEGGAEEAAVTIAGAQLGCQTGGTCEAPALPASFTGQ